jgi:hypothetical protein
VPSSYLVDMSEPEHEACRRLVQMPFLSEGLFASLGLQSSFSWVILQIRSDRLVPTMYGDVDILAGPLTWTDSRTFETYLAEERANHPDWHISRNYEMAALRLARTGGIKWPPSTERLIGVEAKCALVPRSAGRISVDVLKSIKSKPRRVEKIRRQVERLLEIGLD